MTVAVAHQVSPTAHLVLAHAAREAALRKTDLVVLHVTGSLDLDVADAQRRGLSTDVQQAVDEGGFGELEWSVRLAPGDRDDVASAIVELAGEVGADLLVIGARRRSPIGKFLLGSAAQSIILDATVPVLVVKPEK